MISYSIKRGTQTVLSLKATGTVVRRVMGEHLVRMTFERPVYVEFLIGDTVEVFGLTYTLKQLPSPVRKISDSGKHSYSLEFQAPYYDLRDVQYFSLNSDNSLGLGVHTLTGKATDFLDLLLRNLNRVLPGWKIGTVIETDHKTLSFNGNNCLDVLSQLAAEFGTEWHVENMTIHLYRRGEDLAADPELDTSITLQYGPGKALDGIERVNQDTNLVTRLYAYGSEKNLLGGYRDFAPRLQLPASDLKNDGLYLSKNELQYGIREHTETFEDIYPNRIGEVTAVNTIYKFKDAGIDFNVNAQLVPGVTVKVNFLTGQLAGYEFELLDPSGFNNVTKEFTLIKSKDEKAIDLPNEFLRPAVGNLYTLSDLIMPQAYVDEAEENLREVAMFYLSQNAQPKVSYTLSPNLVTFQREKLWLDLCQSVRVVEPIFNLDRKLRIVGLDRNINDPYDCKPVVSETVPRLRDVLARQRQRQLDRVIRNRDIKPPVPAETEWRVQAASRRCVTTLAGAFTGDEEWTVLEQVYKENKELTGAVKPNVIGQPDYIAPKPNLASCPVAQVNFPQPPTNRTLSLTYQIISPNAFRVTVTRNAGEEELYVNYGYGFRDDLGREGLGSQETLVLPHGALTATAEVTVAANLSELEVNLLQPLPQGYTAI